MQALHVWFWIIFIGVSMIFAAQARNIPLDVEVEIRFSEEVVLGLFNQPPALMGGDFGGFSHEPVLLLWLVSVVMSS